MEINNIPIPTTLPEVENLILELYKGDTSPKSVKNIQEVLQRLQKSAQGWHLAQGLLARPAEHVKFFGALTIIVKLNTEKLPDDHALSVLENLVTWLVRSLEDGSGPVVVRKLCSALVTYFIHYSHTWSRCIYHILLCLEHSAYVPLDDVGATSYIEHAVQTLDTARFAVAATFATALAEETTKIDTKTDKYMHLHNRVIVNGKDAATLIATSLNSDKAAVTIQRQKESLLCFRAWMDYAQRSPRGALVQELQELVQPTIVCLCSEELFEPAVGLLSEALNNWQPFFTKAHIDSLYMLFASDWARERYAKLLEGDFDFEEVQFGLFMLAFGDAQMVELMDAEDTRAQSFLVGLTGLLTAKGHPAVEDKIFVPALEFWANFVENLIDTLFTNNQDGNNLPWDRSPLSQVMQVVTHSWKKAQYPSLDVYSMWDSDEKDEFCDARTDVTDYLQGVYPISGLPLIQLFVDLVLQALNNSAWAELEAACFCLGSLADCVSEGESYDNPLTSVFGSSLFDLLRQEHNVVPVKARQTCLYLIERYSEYFQRHPAYLPAALNLLFSAVSDRNLAHNSSKSILKLCTSCREILTSETDAFLEQYNTLRNARDFDSVAEERVVGAIAAIIQSIPNEEPRLDAVQRLLTLINLDITASLEIGWRNAYINPDDAVILRAFDISERPTSSLTSEEVGGQLAVRALRALYMVAKNMQSPVDLDSEDDSHQNSSSDRLGQIHNEVMAILVKIKDLYSKNGEVVDNICSILKAGFSETEPGPFVFPPEMVIQLITSGWKNRIASVMNAASIFVTSLNTAKTRKHVVPALRTLLPWILDLLHQLPDPESDTEISQYGIEFTVRVLARHPEVLMSQATNALEFLFGFAMKLLNGSEPLPKAASADFWKTFIQATSEDPAIQKTLQDAMSHFGPQLAHSLVQNIGGRASRSDIDKLCEPLKKLIVSHVQASKWLEAALSDPSFPSSIVSADDKAMFLKKLSSLRGGRGTNQVVKEFWLSCRGSNFAYVS